MNPFVRRGATVRPVELAFAGSLYAWHPELGVLSLAQGRTASGDDVGNVVRTAGDPTRWFVVARWDYGIVAEVDGSTPLALRRVARGKVSARAPESFVGTYQEVAFFDERDEAVDEAAAYEVLILDRPQREDPGPRSFAARPVVDDLDEGPVVHITLVPARGPRGPRLHARRARELRLEPDTLYSFDVVGAPLTRAGKGAELVVRRDDAGEARAASEIVRLRLTSGPRGRPGSSDAQEY